MRRRSSSAAWVSRSSRTFLRRSNSSLTKYSSSCCVGFICIAHLPYQPPRGCFGHPGVVSSFPPHTPPRRSRAPCGASSPRWRRGRARPAEARGGRRVRGRCPWSPSERVRPCPLSPRAADGHGEVDRLLVVRRRDVRELQANPPELLRLQRLGGKGHVERLGGFLPGVEPVIAVTGELEGRLGAGVLELDRLSLGVDEPDLPCDEADGLIRRAILQHHLRRELRRGDDAARALLDPFHDLHVRHLARNDPGLHLHRGRRHGVRLVLDHRRRRCRLRRWAENHPHHDGRDRCAESPPPYCDNGLLFAGTLSRPELALSDDRNGRPDQCDDSHHEDSCSRQHPEGSEDDVRPDAADETEDDVPLEPVASTLHDQPCQQACRQSHENPRHEHGETHDPSSFTRLTAHPRHFPCAVARATPRGRLRPLDGLGLGPLRAAAGAGIAPSPFCRTRTAASISIARWSRARSSMITCTVGPASPRTRSAAAVEQTMTSTRRSRRPNAAPSAGQAPTRAMFGRPAFAIECSRLWAVSTAAEATPTRVPDGSWAKRWRVSRCASARSAITGTPLPLRSRSTSGRWQKLVTAARQRPACFSRVTVANSPRSTLSTRTGRWASSCPAISRAPAGCIPRGGPPRSPGQPQAERWPRSARRPPGRRRSSRGPPPASPYPVESRCGGEGRGGRAAPGPRTRPSPAEPPRIRSASDPRRRARPCSY